MKPPEFNNVGEKFKWLTDNAHGLATDVVRQIDLIEGLDDDSTEVVNTALDKLTDLEVAVLASILDYLSITSYEMQKVIDLRD